MNLILLVAIGGALGSVARYLVSVYSAQLFGLSFPWGTLTVNIVGSFAMGLLAAFAAIRLSMPNELRVFLATGVLGGFTTFSAFSLDFAVLFERKDYALTAIYVVSSVGLSLMALFAGLWLIRAWLT
jgi:fluoride exporter